MTASSPDVHAGDDDLSDRATPLCGTQLSAILHSGCRQLHPAATTAGGCRFLASIRNESASWRTANTAMPSKPSGLSISTRLPLAVQQCSRRPTRERRPSPESQRWCFGATRGRICCSGNDGRRLPASLAANPAARAPAAGSRVSRALLAPAAPPPLIVFGDRGTRGTLSPVRGWSKRAGGWRQARRGLPDGERENSHLRQASTPPPHRCADLPAGRTTPSADKSPQDAQVSNATGHPALTSGA